MKRFRLRPLGLCAVVVATPIIFLAVIGHIENIEERDRQVYGLLCMPSSLDYPTKTTVDNKEGMQKLRESLPEGYDVNVRFSGGRTPLIMAVDDKDIERVRILLALGADTRIEDDEGRTAESVAKTLGAMDILAALQSHHARTK